MRKRVIGVFFTILLVSSFFSIGDSSVYAKDDITGIKLEKEMRDLIDRGVIEGYGQGNYRPGESITRGQFVAFIARALDLNVTGGSTKFTDVPYSSALADEIYGVTAAGIAKGYNEEKFGMNDKVTREQMAQIIDNALQYLEVERNEASLSFYDRDKISPQFKQAVQRNVHDGIISGYLDGSFGPKRNATRAEAAAFISRMLQTAEKFKVEKSEDPAPSVDEKPAPVPPIVEKPKPAPPVVVDDSTPVKIMGKSVISAEKMAAFVKAQNPRAQDIDEIAKAFIEIGEKYGVRGDIAFAQAILETGWFRFDSGTAVTPDQHNYGGLGVVRKGVKGHEFPTVRAGVTASIQHLFAYASKDKLPAGETIIDPRFSLVSPRGKAPYWKDLSGTWAADKNYGTKILSIYDQLKKY